MKRVKIMLTSIALVAVVGGALAFKAKFDINYCSATPDAGNSCAKKCPNLNLLSTIDPDATVSLVCTTTNGANITDNCAPGGVVVDCARVAPTKIVTNQ